MTRFVSAIMWSAAVALALPARADVVMVYAGTARALYYVSEDGQFVIRSQCPEGTLAADRSTCRLASVKTPSARFRAVLTAKFGTQIEAKERQVAQVLRQLQAVDRRLDLLLDQVPPTGPSPDPAELAAAQQRVVVQDTVVLEWQDQLARIDQALSASPSDQDLIAQREIVRLKLAAAFGEASRLQRELKALRDAFIAAREAFDNPDFQDLLHLRADMAEKWSVLGRDLQAEIDDVQRATTQLRRLEDQLFFWPLPIDAGVMGRFEEAFVQAEVAARTFQVEAAERFRVYFTVPVGNTLQDLRCLVSTPEVGGLWVVQLWKDPAHGVLDRRGDSAIGWVGPGLVRFNGRSEGNFWDYMERSGFMGPAAGRYWELAFHFQNSPDGPYPDPFQKLICAVTLAHL